MAMVIKPKRKFTAGAPSTSDLVEGEIAVNTADKKLYVRDDSNNIVEIGGGGGGSTSDITQSSHGFAVKDAIRHNGSSWVKAQANATTTLALGIVTAVADSNNFTIAQSGRFELSSHGLTVGQWYYLSSAAAGGLVTTEPAISQPIVYVESASFVYVYQYRPTNLLINSDGLTPGDNTVTSAKIVNGTIVADDLADDAVTAAKIADNSVDIARLNVSDGSNGQVLKTDGAGNLGFVTVSIPGAAASFTQVDITAEGDLRLQDASGGQFVALEAPSTIGSSYTLELPAADGSNGQLLKTNGAGALSFTDPPSSGTSRSETFFMGLL
jgi:hypothetical protein